jgi:hypothetical protein
MINRIKGKNDHEINQNGNRFRSGSRHLQRDEHELAELGAALHVLAAELSRAVGVA